MKLITIATCNLAQWALDFEGNYQRIVESIRQAKAKGCALTTNGSHSSEPDTEWVQSWRSLGMAVKTTFSKETPSYTAGKLLSASWIQT